MNIESFANSRMVHLVFRLMGAAMESRFRYRFFPPMKILRGSGIQPGQTVLEVGCGTGFYTLSAAELIGEQGCLVSLDVLSEAVEKVRKKVQSANLQKVHVVKADAMNTGLDAESMDIILLFGVIPAPMLPLRRLLPEMQLKLARDLAGAMDQPDGLQLPPTSLAQKLRALVGNPAGAVADGAVLLVELAEPR